MTSITLTATDGHLDSTPFDSERGATAKGVLRVRCAIVEPPAPGDGSGSPVRLTWCYSAGRAGAQKRPDGRLAWPIDVTGWTSGTMVRFQYTDWRTDCRPVADYWVREVSALMTVKVGRGKGKQRVILLEPVSCEWASEQIEHAAASMVDGPEDCAETGAERR